MQSILDAITEWIKEILIGAINGNLSTMFGDVNEKVGTIAAENLTTLDIEKTDPIRILRDIWKSFQIQMWWN